MRHVLTSDSSLKWSQNLNVLLQNLSQLGHWVWHHVICIYHVQVATEIKQWYTMEHLMRQCDKILQVLQLFLFTVNMIRKRRQKRQFEDNVIKSIIIQANMYLQIILGWLEIIDLYINLLNSRRKKRKLFKAHVLVQLLHGNRYMYYFKSTYSSMYLVWIWWLLRKELLVWKFLAEFP